MCGIFGYVDQRGRAMDHQTLLVMGEKIQHRGPDGYGCYHDEKSCIALGNQRLAIIDIQQGNQPFYSNDHEIVVVQNGEIFNHVELSEELSSDGFCCKTQSDTEVILRLYERDGIEGISKLNGMFAVAIYDKREGSVYLVRDRVGEKPLYYLHDEGRVLFASEIKSILVASGKRELDPQSLNKFFSFNYVPSPSTLFQGVLHVRPGHWIKITEHNVEETCWWDISTIQQIEKNEEEWIEEFGAILDDAVRLRLRADVPFGAFLSGGVDSSTVVGVMSKHLPQPVKTFCIGFDDSKYDESPFAQEAAMRFATDHVMEKVEPNLIDLWPMATYHCDQPHGDVSFLPTYKVALLASEHVKMVLTGDGADELFAGYDKYRDFFTEEVEKMSDEVFQQHYAKNISLFTEDKREQLYVPELREKIGCISMQKVLEPIYEQCGAMDRINQALYIDTMLLLSGNNLVKPDRMGMAVSIENRSPFLDHRMIELAFSMPGSLKLKGGETKYIYKKAVAPLIGANLAYRTKQMFTVPIGNWFKTDLAELCNDLLFSERTVARNYFNTEYVRSLYDKHCEGIENNTREIRSLLAFEIWCREFLDE